MTEEKALRDRGNVGRRRADSAADAGVPAVEVGAEKVGSRVGCQRDERAKQRVLNQVLAFIFTNETSNQILHFSKPHKREFKNLVVVTPHQRYPLMSNGLARLYL